MRPFFAMVLAGSIAMPAAAQFTFTVLPSDTSQSGSWALARGISGDGKVIVGGASGLQNTLEKGHVWRSTGSGWARTQLPSQGTPGWGRALAASHDGDTVVGMADLVSSGGIVYGTPAVWTDVLSGSPTLTTPLDDTSTKRRGIFSGVSADGSRAAGYAGLLPAGSVPLEAWTYAGGSPQQISPSGSVNYSSTPWVGGNTLSADGLAFVGTRFDSVGAQKREAFRWTASGGFQVLPARPTVYTGASAEVISANGNVVGGHVTTSAGGVYNGDGKPTLWINGVRLDLALPSNTFNGRVLGLSADGSIAAGVQYNGSVMPIETGLASMDAVVWINNEPFRLSEYLTSRGVDLQGIVTRYLMGVSNDGRTLVGYGSVGVSDFNLRSFVVTIPGAGTGTAALAALGCVAARRRRG
ncbi:MAG: hypothetical protein JNM07_04490 [Phycisphaerae bacterium]|nr:hypothetical protein [Phycisphaerae bacterium]